MEIDLSEQLANPNLPATPDIVRKRLIHGLPLGLEATGLLGRFEERTVDLKVRRHVPRLFHTRVVSMDAHSPQGRSGAGIGMEQQAADASESTARQPSLCGSVSSSNVCRAAGPMIRSRKSKTLLLAFA